MTASRKTIQPFGLLIMVADRGLPGVYRNAASVSDLSTSFDSQLGMMKGTDSLFGFLRG
jgi:hypothetical protein